MTKAKKNETDKKTNGIQLRKTFRLVCLGLEKRDFSILTVSVVEDNYTSLLGLSLLWVDHGRTDNKVD